MTHNILDISPLWLAIVPFYGEMSYHMLSYPIIMRIYGDILMLLYIYIYLIHTHIYIYIYTYIVYPMILSEAHVISPHDPMCRTSPKIRMLRMGAFFMALTTPPCGGPWSVRRSWPVLGFSWPAKGEVYWKRWVFTVTPSIIHNFLPPNATQHQNALTICCRPNSRLDSWSRVPKLLRKHLMGIR